MLEIKNIEIEISDIFYELLVDWTQVRKASDLDDISIETTKTGKKTKGI